MRKPVIYQLLPRLFGNKHSASRLWGTVEENGVGKLADINAAALKGIHELGATHVWYTGILEHASVTDYPGVNISGDHPAVVKGRAGSPYAVRDYYDVAPDLAVDAGRRVQEFEELVARTHAHSLKVIIDFVPNHVARSYRSDAQPPGKRELGQDDDTTLPFHPDNNFYYLPGRRFVPPQDYVPLGGLPHAALSQPYHEFPAKASGNDAFTAEPEIHAWFETVKLNYGIDILNGRSAHFEPIPDTWKKMRDILLYWTVKGVDGFRCDMAEMVPVAFWSWVIPQVKSLNPDLVFIAEIYTHNLYRTFVEEARFDFLYDKVLLYDALRQITHDQWGTIAIARIQRELMGLEYHMLHFLENHDEQRIASRFFAGDPWKAVPAMVVSATIDCGPVMIYFGQEVGEPALGASGFSSDDGRTTIFDYWHVPEHQKWMNGGLFDGGLLSDRQKELRHLYARLLQLASSHPAITEGEYADLTPHHLITGEKLSFVHAFLRYKESERLLIVTNFSEHEAQIDLTIAGDICEKMGMGSLTFSLRGIFGTEAVHTVDASNCHISIKAWEGYIFSIGD